MSTREKHIDRRVLAWAIVMTVALYAMVWAAAGPPAAAATPTTGAAAEARAPAN